jgi:Xaa-Pro dipeptidase
MSIRRRDFLKTSVGAAIGAGMASSGCADSTASEAGAFDGLVSMTEDVVPISDGERWRRIEKAQSLMAAAEIDAVYLDVGTSMEYFTAVRM